MCTPSTGSYTLLLPPVVVVCSRWVGYRGVYEIMFKHGRVPRAGVEAQRKWVMRRKDILPDHRITKSGHHEWCADEIDQWLRDNPHVRHAKMRPKKPRKYYPPEPKQPELRRRTLIFGDNVRSMR